MDSRILIFIVTTLSVVAATFIGVAVGTGEFLLPTIAVIALAAVVLVASPQVSVFLAICFVACGLNAPGLPGQFGLYEVACASVIGCGIVAFVFRRKVGTLFTPAHQLLILFLLIVAATGFIRGFGIRFFGGGLWGGFIYIKLLLAAMLVFAMPIVNLRSAWWRAAILGMGVLSFVPLFADLMVLAGFNYGLIRMFVQTGGMLAQAMQYEETGQGIGRLSSAGLCAQYVILTLLALVSTKKLLDLRSLWAPAIVVFAMILSFLSGFRLMTASLILCIAIAIWLQRSLTIPRVVFGFLAALLSLAVVYQIADILPSNMQRAISWLPGIQISQTASIDAEATVSWRLDLWHEAVKDIPTYFWIGKGFAFDGTALQRSMMMDPNSIEWALITGAYHNGYLSLLILFGIGGLFIGLLLIISVAWRHLKISRLPWKNPRLHRMHQGFLCFTIANLAVYLTVYGDVSTVFPQYFFFWAVMETLHKSDEEEPAAVAMNEEGVPEEFAHLE